MTRRVLGMVLAVALGLGLAAGGAPPAQAHGPVPAQPQEGCLPPPPANSPDVPWSQQQLRPERAWELTQGAGVVVAIVDSGVDGSIPQLRDRVLPGVDITGGGAANSDCVGHGTFVAGIVAAAVRPDTGFAGVAPEATILPVRITRTADSGEVDALALAEGIRTAVDRGARVINVSASTTSAPPGLRSAVEHAAARDVVLVASAANGAEAGDLATFPATLPSVLAVGAVDAEGKHAQFSQTGPHLALAAPGVDVIGLGPGGPGHWEGSGTSFAAPFVSGTAALIRAYHPELSAVQVAERLKATATAPAAALPDPALGWGVVDPVAAVSALLPAENSGDRAEAVLAPFAPAPPDHLPAIIASVLAVTTAMLVVVGAGLSVRLGHQGRRRSWRPARVLRPDRSIPAAEDRSGTAANVTERPGDTHAVRDTSETVARGR
ncbi:type VII secretion-associated serine protease mycosin [Pseudonocardia sp. HH130630-07]|uniref:type VII secretion-associated serine protease mycosin n=1 Tax=Pseudonocardia sp. HH130630-07 TaxID=1690815 RepID=UPI000839C464|nr:type VII secretion-associated serine protease mycosin [Pseudonocardia sp. HH130630-07]